MCHCETEGCNSSSNQLPSIVIIIGCLIWTSVRTLEIQPHWEKISILKYLLFSSLIDSLYTVAVLFNSLLVFCVLGLPWAELLTNDLFDGFGFSQDFLHFLLLGTAYWLGAIIHCSWTSLVFEHAEVLEKSDDSNLLVLQLSLKILGTNNKAFQPPKY